MQKKTLLGASGAVALMLAYVAPTTAAAQASDEGSIVDELVVTGRSLEQTTPLELAKLGHDLVIVSDETIKDKAYLDLSTALQTEVPGLYLAQQSGPFSYVYLSLQGSRTQDVLWTVDGVRINNRLYSATAPTDTLPASMIERIEVLKGGESLFYGTQGIAGTINVVTRAFSSRFGGEATIGGDTNDGFHADGYVHGAAGRHKFVAFLNKDKSDGFASYDAYQPSATARRRGYDVGTGGLKYGVDLTDDLSLTASYIHTDAKLDYPGARLTAFSRNTRDEDIVSAKLDYAPSEGLQFFIKGYLHDWDSRYTTINNVIGSPGATVVADDKLYWGYRDSGVNVMGKLPLGGVDVLAGYDFQSYKARDEVLIIEQLAEEVHAVFGQVRTNSDFSDRLSLAAGLRHNKTGETEATVWNASGRFDINPTLFVQANLGDGFSLPTAEQLFAVDPFSTFGNRGLKPEKSRSLNVSIGGRLADRVEWMLTGFNRDVKDLITFTDDLDLIPDAIEAHPDFASSGEAYVNLGKVEFEGFELIAAGKLTDDIRISASYTQTEAVNQGSSLQLARIPEEYAKAQIEWRPDMGRFGASASVLWTGDVFGSVPGAAADYEPNLASTRINYGDYYVVDMAAHAYLDADQRHRLTASVQNLFDEDYATRVSGGNVDAPAPGATRFLFRSRGTPRTVSIRYSYAFGN